MSETLGRAGSAGPGVREGSSGPGARPATLGRGEAKKTDTLASKISTLGRKKKKVRDEEEAAHVELEGEHAIDSSGILLPMEILPEQCQLEEGEERWMITPESREDPKVREICKLIMAWINDELAEERIIVKNIQEDIYDGLVIQKLLEKLTGVKMEVPEVSQSSEGQRQKLRVVLQVANQILAQPQWQEPKWTADTIHDKDLVAILHLLIALAIHFRAPIRFPEHCSVQVIVVQKREGQLRTRYVTEELTSKQEELGLRGEKDAFDTLLDHAPDKSQVVMRSLVTFVNKHLNKINLEVTELETQFQDGVYLVLLMGLLEGYFVPLYAFHLQVSSFEQKVGNVGLAFQLMEESGMAKPRARAEDIVNGDVKSTLRVLYTLFTKYKHM